MNANIYGNVKMAEKSVRKDVKFVYEMQSVTIPAGGEIKFHNHIGDWDVWLILSEMKAYVCPSGEGHSLRNETDAEVTIMAIKGREKSSYEELKSFFEKAGFSVTKGSIIFYKKAPAMKIY